MDSERVNLEEIGAKVASSTGDGLIPLIERYTQKVEKMRSAIVEKKRLMDQIKMESIALDGALHEAIDILLTLRSARDKWGVVGVQEVITEVIPGDRELQTPTEVLKEHRRIRPPSEYRKRYNEGTLCVHREDGQQEFCPRRLTTKQQRAEHLCKLHSLHVSSATLKRKKRPLTRKTKAK